ncbi:MAG: hypothetical protein HY235_10925 [Acidobacteria bacterium]|nr:hypothetical protein [Acidobacteriota bacterium]
MNLQSVGLMGHSRGGEGVRAAYQYNRQEGAPFGIRAVLEIGPVDFGRLTGLATPNPLFDASDVAFSVLLPACDRDVTDNQGMRVYDRARVLREKNNPTPKSQIYLLGANHNFFNSEWLPEDSLFRCIDFPILTDREQQEQIGLVYVMGFFRTHIGGENFAYLFTGDAPPPQSIRVGSLPSYTESPNDILMIDDSSAPKSPDFNNTGGANSTVNVAIKTCSGNNCNDPPPGSWYHDQATFAARLSWPVEGNATPTLTMQVAGGLCQERAGRRDAVRKMKGGPSEPPCGRRLQTAGSCFGQRPRW